MKDIASAMVWGSSEDICYDLLLLFLDLVLKFRWLSDQVCKQFYDQYFSNARCYLASPVQTKLLV
jgi:hypothetical protein